MKIEILTLFPEMFSALDSSILGKARKKNLIDIECINIRDYTKNKHKKVDDYTFGGGPGMVMTPQPIFDALNSINASEKKIVYLSPKGSILKEEKVKELSKYKELVLLCGHYEGIDERVLKNFPIEEISIGDYILTGGEPAAIVLLDTVLRLLPGVLGNEASVENESIYSGLLEAPQYTKPREYEGCQVPDILLSGNHGEIDLWRFEESLKITKEKRPDLFEKYVNGNRILPKKKKKILLKIKSDNK